MLDYNIDRIRAYNHKQQEYLVGLINCRQQECVATVNNKSVYLLSYCYYYYFYRPTVSLDINYYLYRPIV